LIGVYGVESKIVDFTTNGMETGILLLFLAWMIDACLTQPPRQTLQIGLAWVGLRWSRPDSFISTGAFGLTLLLIPFGSEGWKNRPPCFRQLVMAGIITTAL